MIFQGNYLNSIAILLSSQIGPRLFLALGYHHHLFEIYQIWSPPLLRQWPLRTECYAGLYHHQVMPSWARAGRDLVLSNSYGYKLTSRCLPCTSLILINLD